MAIPEYLAPTYKLLDDYGWRMRKTHGETVMKYIKYDDAVFSLILDLKLPDEPWLKISPSLASELKNRERIFSDPERNLRLVRDLKTSPPTSRPWVHHALLFPGMIHDPSNRPVTHSLLHATKSDPFNNSPLPPNDHSWPLPFLVLLSREPIRTRPRIRPTNPLLKHGGPHHHWYRLRTQACLLYTSPSPRDRQKSRMPSSA